MLHSLSTLVHVIRILLSCIYTIDLALIPYEYDEPKKITTLQWPTMGG